MTTLAASAAAATNGFGGIELTEIEAQDLPAAIAELLQGGGRMQMAYAWHPRPGHIELRYLGSRGQHEDFLMWRCMPRGPMPSVAAVSPLLGWYEREIADLFGRIPRPPRTCSPRAAPGRAADPAAL